MVSEYQVRLEAIIDNAVDAIITIDERGLIESVNPATLVLFGYSQTELIGENIRMLMPSPYREKHDGYLTNYHDSGVRKIIGIGREVQGQRKDGTVFPLHLAVSEFSLADRRGFIGIIRDITDLKEAEAKIKTLNEDLERRVQERTEELRVAQAELVQKERLATLGRVSGGIAHEIRNSLNALKTSSYYLLNAKAPSPEKTREHLERIDRQVSMIDKVITALSDVARLPEPVQSHEDVNQHLREVTATYFLPANIELRYNLCKAEPLLVRVDAQQLLIVLRNLVRNACDAMPEGGTLSIGSNTNERETIIYVEDTGCGISAEDLSKITEPFFTSKARGMGLGLAISRTIIEKNGARLVVESELGKGSIFSIVFDK